MYVNYRDTECSLQGSCKSGARHFFVAISLAGETRERTFHLDRILSLTHEHAFAPYPNDVRTESSKDVRKFNLRGLDSSSMNSDNCNRKHSHWRLVLHFFARVDENSRQARERFVSHSARR